MGVAGGNPKAWLFFVSGCVMPEPDSGSLGLGRGFTIFGNILLAACAVTAVVLLVMVAIAIVRGA